MVTGDAEPYGDPNTFPQKMRKRLGSNAFPWPSNGPHLTIKERLDVGYLERMGGLPVFDVCAPGKSVTYNHNIVSCSIEFTKCLVGHWNIPQHTATLQLEGGNDLVALVIDQMGVRGTQLC
jgi:hypothetical protein